MQTIVFSRSFFSFLLLLGVCFLVVASCRPNRRTAPTTSPSGQDPALGSSPAATPGGTTEVRPARGGVTVGGDEEGSPLDGAWRLVQTNEPSRTAPQAVKIFGNRHFTFADYDLDQRKFVRAGGGTFTAAQGRYTETYEYDSQNPEKVATSLAYSFDLTNQTLRLTGQQDGRQIEETWERVDEGESPLAGTWRIRERQTQPGQMSVMQRGPRKTLKWLSGTRFQWAAINTDTKEFFGTGGGTYTLDNGTYTEHIEFFSRDPQRVGASLSFEYEVRNGDWHHRGRSTAGDPMFEIWALER
jgi:hypothetical protein